MGNSIFSSSIGQKVIVGVTGLLLVGFIVAHLLGNLQMFLGQDAINSYAVMLQELGALLWVARIGLLVIFVSHVVFALKLAQHNKAARPVPYGQKNFAAASFASRHMVHVGMIMLLFVIVHLLHFTFGYVAAENASMIDWQGRHDVYSMVVLGFEDIRYSAFYIICLLALGVHLSHGIQSAFQTIGFYHENYVTLIRRGSIAIGWLLALGYISIPVSVLLGIISLSVEG